MIARVPALLLILIGAGVSVPFCGIAQSGPAAEPVAERLLDAVGGRAAWAGLSGTINDSLQYRLQEPAVVRSVITMDFRRPRFRIETTAPGLHLIRVVDDGQNWRLNRQGEIEDLPAELLLEDRQWYAGHVYRTLHRIAARDPALRLAVGTADRLEVYQGDARIAWFALDVRGEPYAFGSHDDDTGSICGPWSFIRDGIHHPAWVANPDGSWRATVTELVINAPPGDAAFRRPGPAWNRMFPRWSRDGGSIVFTSDRYGDPEIHAMNANGSGLIQLTHSPGRDAHPYYSRDGMRILFQSPRGNGRDTNIYVMNADGSGVIRLTDLGGFAGVPVFSPDESLIAFQWRGTNDFDDDARWRIVVMNADGSGRRSITPGQANDQVPNWSKDGRRLIFYSDRSGRDQIYTMKPDGTDVRQLAVTASNDSGASWSPDNSSIAFTSDRSGNTEIHTMDADGGNVRRLTHTASTERASAWSPDGRQIVFSSDGDGPSRIFIMNADGTGSMEVAGSAE